MGFDLMLCLMGALRERAGRVTLSLQLLGACGICLGRLVNWGEGQ